jgi:hypothetical protein
LQQLAFSSAHRKILERLRRRSVIDSIHVATGGSGTPPSLP